MDYWSKRIGEVALAAASFFTRFIDKYKLDLSAIRKIDDIEPFLKQIKEGEPGIVPFGTTRGLYMNSLYGIDWRVSVYHGECESPSFPRCQTRNEAEPTAASMSLLVPLAKPHSSPVHSAR